MRIKRLAMLVMAAALIIIPTEKSGFGLEGLSIEANAAETQYTEGFWTYVKHSDGTAGIAAYAGLDGNITIPSSIGGLKVTAIEDKAFFNNKNIKTVTIPSTVSSIGAMSFAGSGLTSITIPETVTTWNGISYHNAKLPSGMYVGTSSDDNYYQNGAFAECANLETVVFKAEKVPNSAFYSCPKLKNVTLGEKTRYIGYSAFYSDEMINTFTVKSDLYEIGDQAFWNCKNMKSISLGNQLKKLGYFAFAGSGLTSVTIPKTVTTWNGISYHNAKLPSGKYVGNIDDYYQNAAFAECPNLTEVNIGHLEIPNSLFYNSTHINIHTMKNTSAYNLAISNDYAYTLFNAIPSTSVKLSKSSYTLVKGETLKLYPNLTPMNSTDLVTWESGNESIATIDENNVVNAKSTGLVAMKCTTTSGKTYTFEVNVVGSGTTTADTEAKKNIALSTVKGITDKAYTGNQTTQSIKVMFNPCTELIPDVDYTVSYKNNVNVGTATVTITGKGSYTGTIEKTYSIRKDESIPVVTDTKAQVYTDRVTISWKKVTGATGYNIYVNGKKINSKAITDNTYTITGLSKNTTYSISVTSISSAGESGKSDTSSVKTGSLLLGDINGDGKISIIDAMRIFHYVSGRNKNIELSKADINGDGKVNIIDAMKIFHYVSGRNKEY